MIILSRGDYLMIWKINITYAKVILKVNKLTFSLNLNIYEPVKQIQSSLVILVTNIPSSPS